MLSGINPNGSGIDEAFYCYWALTEKLKIAVCMNLWSHISFFHMHIFLNIASIVPFLVV